MSKRIKIQSRVEPFGITIKDYKREKFLSLNKRATIDILNNYDVNNDIGHEVKDKIKEFSLDYLMKKWNSDWGSALFSAPELISLGVTRECPLHCTHCYSSSGIKLENELNDDELYDILDQICDMKVYNLEWTGGEPFSRENFIEFCKYIDNRIHYSILSNGFYLNSEIATELKELKNLNGVQISIDGGTEKCHDSIRGRGSFKKAVNAVKILKEKDILVGINTVVVEEDKEKIESVAELAAELQPDYFRMIPVTLAGRGQNFPKNRRKVENLIFETSKKYEDKVFISIRDDVTEILFEDKKPNFEKKYHIFEEKLNTCQAGTTFLHIEADGKIYPCGFFNESYIVGDLRNDKLEDIWKYSERLKEIRSIKEFNNYVCKACNKICMSCRAEAYNILGSIDAPDPLCEKINLADYMIA